MKNTSYVPRPTSYVLAALIVLAALTGCAIPKDAKSAATPDQEMTISDPNSADVRLLNELKALRLENERLRTAGGNSGPQGNLAQPVSLVPGASGPSATIVQPGTVITRYDPLFSPMIPSRTVYLPGEIDWFVSFEGNGGWAPCMGSERLWHPVNVGGRIIMALTGKLPGCIVATDCPMTNPRGICKKQLTIYHLERSNPTWVVDQKTVTVTLQKRPQCAAIGMSCF